MILAFAGTFDIFTNGHLWTVREMCKLAGNAFVIVANNPDKKTMFSVEERVSIIERVLADEMHGYVTDVIVIDHEYIAQYAKDKFRLVRGIRDSVDFEYEKKLNFSNTQIIDGNQTLYFIPPPEIANISSSYIKGWMGPIGWHHRIKNMLPAISYDATIAKWLEKHWMDSVEELNNCHKDISHEAKLAQFNDVIEAYRQPHRIYHNLEHIVHAMTELRRASFRSRWEWAETVQILFWHDYVIGLNSIQTDEEISAVAAEANMEGLIDDQHVRNIADGVRSTNHSAKLTRTLTAPEKAAISCDLAILGRPEEEYNRYTIQVREEYRAYPDVEYWYGRRTFLRAIQEEIIGSKLFPDHSYHEAYNDRAGTNIQKEIEKLSLLIENSLK